MKLKVTVDGREYDVEVEVAPEPQQQLPTFMVQSGAAAFGGFPADRSRSDVGEKDVDGAKVCRTPISGIVVKSNVRLGQTIEAGDLLFVLEAMKMETEVTAPVGGKVAEVKVNLGDSVKSGQVVLIWA